MRVLELKNLQREEGEIFYLRKYICDALIEFPTSKEEVSVLFSIETNPFGQKNIEISFNKALNYPLIPVKKALLQFIQNEENEGRLPC